MHIESITYNTAGNRITITHERPGVVFVEYSDGRKAESFSFEKGRSEYLIVDEIFGVSTDPREGDEMQSVVVAIRNVSRGESN